MTGVTRQWCNQHNRTMAAGWWLLLRYKGCAEDHHRGPPAGGAREKGWGGQGGGDLSQASPCISAISHFTTHPYAELVLPISCAMQARGRGVPLRVSAISPGIVETEFFAVRARVREARCVPSWHYHTYSCVPPAAAGACVWRRVSRREGHLPVQVPRAGRHCAGHAVVPVGSGTRRDQRHCRTAQGAAPIRHRGGGGGWMRYRGGGGGGIDGWGQGCFYFSRSQPIESYPRVVKYILREVPNTGS